MKLTFDRKHAEAGNAVSFIFEMETVESWEAGQYITLTMPEVPIGNNERTFTVSAAPYEKHIQITTRVTESAFKQKMSHLHKGEVIEADQLGGDFIWEDKAQPVVFVAGGIGITPFHSILKQRNHENKTLPVRLLYGNRDENIVFQAELDQWSKQHPEFSVHYVIGEQLDIKKMSLLIPELKQSYVYLSGPEPMVDDFEKQLKDFGLKSDQLKEDWFPGYDQRNY